MRLKKSPFVFALLVLSLPMPILGTSNLIQTRRAPRNHQLGNEEEYTREHIDSFMKERLYGSENIDELARLEAWNAALSMPHTKPKQRYIGGKRIQITERWRPVGPIGILTGKGKASGRINTIAISPADPNLMLVGGATGGIWRSVNDGRTFSPVSDNIVGLSVGSIAFYKKDPSIVYAGMGDPVYGYLGHGVLKSTDSGRTWTRVNNASLNAPCTISKIAVDPTNPNRVYVTQGSSMSSSKYKNSGFYLSTDGGIQWRQTLGGEALDLAIDTTSYKTFYVAVDSGAATSGKPGIYRSTDAGETWTHILDLTGGASPVTFDSGQSLYVRVATAGRDPGFVYALASGTISNQATNRLLISSDGGTTWTSMNADSIDAVQPYWDFYVAADPRSPETLYAGAIDIYKSTDRGATWTNLTGNVQVQSPPSKVVFSTAPGLIHVDQHSLVFSPHDAGVIYASNDGGIFKSIDGGTSFKSLNRSLSLTQFYSLALDPGNAKFVFGGTQDNGTIMWAPNVRDRTWTRVLGSDGGRCAVCRSSPKRVFATRPSGPISVVHHGELKANVSFGFEGDRKALIYPILTAGKNSKLYVGTYRVWVSRVGCNELNPNDPKAWVAPGGDTDLTKGNPDKLTAIAVADSNSDVIYTGSGQARVMRSTDGGKNWTDVSQGLPNRFVSSIVVDHSNPRIAFITFSGLNCSHVFKTSDAGASWIDIANGLPNIPVNALIVAPRDPDLLYIGTDIGVFRSKNCGGHWELFNNGMPPVIVKALAIGPGGRIVAATFGRGVYVLETR